jgi:hypothetical protein
LFLYLYLKKKKRKKRNGGKETLNCSADAGPKEGQAQTDPIDLAACAGLQNGANCLKHPFTPAVGLTRFLYTSIKPIKATK